MLVRPSAGLHRLVPELQCSHLRMKAFDNPAGITLIVLPVHAAGKAGKADGQVAGGPSARPTRAPEGRKRPGLGFDDGLSKRARAEGGPKGDRPPVTGGAQSAEARANGSVPDCGSRHQSAAGSAATAVTMTAPAAHGGGAAADPGAAPSLTMQQDARPAERPFYSDQCTAFVKNIAPDTTDDQLRAAFAGCGELQALRHLRDAKGSSRVCWACFLPGWVICHAKFRL